MMLVFLTSLRGTLINIFMYLMLGARVDVKNETGKAGIRMIVLKGKRFY